MAVELTTSEARAEAASIVLHVLLARMTPRVLAAIYAAAIGEGAMMLMPNIEEEIAWICRDAPKATALMLARDGCA